MSDSDGIWVLKAKQKTRIEEIAKTFCLQIKNILDANRKLTDFVSVDIGDYLIIPLHKAKKDCVKSAGGDWEQRKLQLIRYSEESWEIALLLRLVQSGKYETNSDSAIAKAVENVRKIIKDNNPCSRFFGSNALEALNIMETRFRKEFLTGLDDSPLGIRMRNPTTFFDEKGVAKFVIYVDAIVNGSGPFYNVRSKTRFGGYSPGQARSQALQIIHELGHAVYKDGKPIIEVDGNNPDLSTKNTEFILKDCQCRAEIDKIKQ